jgi:hypothetical protein
MNSPSREHTLGPHHPTFHIYINNKGRKRVIFHEPDNATTPAAYTSNLNTSQQELLCLHETYAHADMKEIQHKSKTVKLRQTYKSQHITYQNVSHAPKIKVKRDHLNNTAGPSHKKIATRGQTCRYTTWMQLMS